ncbi:PREDICTED: neprilysin-1-like [Wasmannia auropunctata]|uniref:neprilysin-1-like n=1 Tax=Wasmannia auropunctata TaxID=64793 RepID=UPI0005EE381E|nr:PREDICTED: neprilysin-1-like [Wasmannia auropunctata]
MRRFILLAFIGVLLIKNVTPKNQRYPSHLAWLFGSNKNLNENEEESKEESKEEDKSTVCQSQECKKIAQIISESMDKSMDPCDDFYEYACGKWPEHNPAPKGMSSWSMFASAQMNVMKQIKEIFDEGPKDDDMLAVKLAKKWYTICMDTDAMDRQGLEPLVLTLARIGGWPIIMEPDEWNEQEYSWQKVDDQYVRLIGRNAFHDVRVDELYNDSNETEKIIHISIPHLPPRSYRLLSTIVVDESDEDTSDEEKQSDEQNGSQEPGSEDEDDDKSKNNDNNDDEGDNNDDDEDDDNDDDEDDDNNDDEDDDNNDDEDDNNNKSSDKDEDDKDDDNNDKDDDNDDTNEQDDDENAKKKIIVTKTGKLKKNKKLEHSRKIKSNTNSKKHKNHKMKKERTKRRAIPINISDKLRARKDDKNRMKQARRKKLEKTLAATTPRISTEETTDEIDEIKKYTDYITKVACAIAKARDVKVSEEHMNRDIKDMIAFQLKLVDISADFSDEEKMTLDDMQEWYDEKNPKTSNSAIDWMYKIGELFDEAHVPIDSDLNVEIGPPEYLEDLISLLDETPSRTIVNYIHWNFLSRIITTTTSEMRKLYDAWEGNDDDDDDDDFLPKRALKCTRKVDMSNMLAYEYVRNHFSDNITTIASDMMDDIQKEVEYQIKESDWMDEETKDFVLAKLVDMGKFIGYPDWYRNDTIVKRYFQGLILGNSFYENTMSYQRYSKWKGLRKLLKEDEEDDMMTMSPLMVNAFFSPWDNSVAFSAADFQSPLFAFDRPQAINYGIVGTIMGHEVNHGFDDSGHLYDNHGEIVEWLSAMADAYGKKAECFVEQFNNYPIDKESNYKIKDYGNQTAGENIADTMGLEAAFRAYQRRERQCGKPNTVLPDLEDVTNDQLYFLSFANLWCEMDTDIIKSAKHDVHSPGRLRVIGSVSNSQDFAKAFNCPVGSAMNPKRKCNIWK